MVWYYADEGRQKGPVSEAEFDQLLANGKVKPDTLVWKDGMEDWQPMSTVSRPVVGLSSNQTPSSDALVFPAQSAPGAGVGGESGGDLYNPDFKFHADAKPADMKPAEPVKASATPKQDELFKPVARSTPAATPVAPSRSSVTEEAAPAAVFSGAGPAHAGFQLKNCAECGTAYAASALQWFGRVGICNACKPQFLANVAQVQPLHGYGNTYVTMEVQTIGVWRRAFAKLLDTFVVSMLLGLIVTVGLGIEQEPPPSFEDLAALEQWAETQRPIVLGMLALGLVYNTIMIAGFGRTIGKFICRCRVIQTDGQHVDIGHAFLRAAIFPIIYLVQLNVGNDLPVLPTLLFLIYFPALFDPRRRTLIDRMCDTRVVG